MSPKTVSDQATIEELEAQLRRLTFLHENLEMEFRHARQVEALEREKLKLGIMNELLRRLPPPPQP